MMEHGGEIRWLMTAGTVTVQVTFSYVCYFVRKIYSSISSHDALFLNLSRVNCWLVVDPRVGVLLFDPPQEYTNQRSVFRTISQSILLTLAKNNPSLNDHHKH